ncbi:NAD(P)-dependent oxidoreductase [Roseococcus microcysteis]|uniref:NAD(P)-dependent oxidoreductase n=1 Tax=Roseococcus microcysteis TaxID=2771361 RepID=UPI00168BE3B5|nr:NAD(P)-dependent oxidoreductase [Roseococcus microcysteis]
MRRALIGHTGFVGSNLRAAGHWTDLFNSRNFHDMQGQRFDEVVCCGVSAVKWQANADPARDWAGIAPLLDVLDTVQAAHVTLISTIDVYPDPAACLDEAHAPDGTGNHAYGRHRLEVERRVTARFKDHAILRLPALFGPGLKKNIVFDLMHGNRLDAINPASVFQWYPLERLPADMALARKLGLPLVNLFTQPLPTRRIIDLLRPGATVGAPADPAPRYDTRTRHGPAFGGMEGYVMSADAVLDALARFVAAAPPR